MKANLVLMLSVSLCAVAANNSSNGVKNRTGGSKKSDGKVVVNQNCNLGAAMKEISGTLKKELEAMKKEIIEHLDKKFNNVPLSVRLLQKDVQKLGKELTQRLDKIPASQNRDPWIKMNTAPVCFGARNNQFGKFVVPSAGKLVSIKLVHMYGDVTCDKNSASFWSYWGCSIYHGLREKVDVVITTSSNKMLLPASQFIRDSTHKWSSILGYNSFSPEIVLSVFSNPPSVTKGQELRLWYGEDLANSSEGDNDGLACCDVYARFL